MVTSAGDRNLRSMIELLTTEGLGHNRILRDPEVIDAAVRFVAGQESQKNHESQKNPES